MNEIHQRVILLVEDNSDDEVLTLRALRKSKLRNPIVVVRDGAEALDYIFVRGVHAGRDPHIQLQVVLLDIHLPKLDGLSVLRHIRDDERTRMLPVVMLTSSNEDQDLDGSYELGVNSYVRKPVGVSEFFDAVQQLGMYWLVLNEPSPRSLRGAG
jgi:CheY-like chemotaxis protein